MRRCGKASCLVLIGVLAAATVASGAFAARGGQGAEHGKAKGHSKHTVVAPLLPPQPGKVTTRIRAAMPAVTHVEVKHGVSAPGVQVRHNHMTICHRTGSGSYIVISPSIRGAMKGHLPHGDFPYVDGCRVPVTAPTPSPAPDPRPKPPGEGTSVGSAPTVASGSARELPFTGLPIWIPLLAGAGLLSGGLMLRRNARGTR